MLALYTLFVTSLKILTSLVNRRAKSLETKYKRVSLTAKKLANEPLPRRGNRSDADPYLSARRQYDLGRLVHKRDKLERKQFAWQLRADWLGKSLARVRSWKGLRLPYLIGVLDVTLVMAMLDHFGLGTVDFSDLLQLAQEHLTPR